jgi:hypothetical protein
MKFTKTALALLIPTLALGIVGCGSDDSEPKSSTINAQFIDSAVTGLNYACGEHTGQTDSEGKFNTSNGQVCDFSLNGLELGSAKVTADSLIVTPYTIAETVTQAVKIASLLQSIDADGIPENGISVVGYDASKLPKDILEKEETEFLQALRVAGVSDVNIVSFAEAKKHLDANVPGQKGFHSPAVKRIIKDIETIIPDLHKQNYQEKLAEYKKILEQGDNSNNADIDVLTAVIEIAEVLNDDHVKQRIKFDYSNVNDPLFTYEALLPQAIDYAINKTPDLVINSSFDQSLASTDEDAEILFKLAKKLISASDKLSISFADINRVAEYTKSKDNHLTYQDAQSLRVVALTVANVLSLTSAYNAGSDENYLVQTAKNLKIMVGKYGDNLDTDDYDWGYQGSVEYPVTSAEYSLASAFPEQWIKDENVFLLRQDPIYLDTALNSLRDAVEIANTKIDLSEFLIKEELDEWMPLLNNLNQHLQAKNGAEVLFDFSDNAVKAKLNIQAAYNLNTAIGRHDLSITENTYNCEVNKSMSQFMNSPICYKEGAREEFFGNYGNYAYMLDGESADHELNFTVIGGKLNAIVISCEEKNGDGVFKQCDFLTTLQ